MGSIMYAGTTKGGYTLKSNDGSWTVQAKGLSQWEINDVAVVPGFPNKVLAGTRGDGGLVSEDFGETWRKPNRGKPGPGKVKCVTISPHDSSIWYAGTEPIAVWVTSDSGTNWDSLDGIWEIPTLANIDYPVPAVEPHVRDIIIHPSDANIIYATLQVGYMIKSTDGGMTWTMVNQNVDADIHVVVAHPDDPEHVYVSTGGHSHRLGEAPGRALYESRDGGDSWEPIAMEFEQEYSVPLAMHPRNPNVLYSAIAFDNPGGWRGREGGAKGGVIRTNDGGISWAFADTGFEEVTRDFVETITFDEILPDHVYLGTRKGDVFSSEDAGESWSKIDIDLPELTDIHVISF